MSSALKAVAARKHDVYEANESDSVSFAIISSGIVRIVGISVIDHWNLIRIH